MRVKSIHISLTLSILYIFTTATDKTPQTNGVGASTISHSDCGSTGINVCGQQNGYKILWRDSTHEDNLLQYTIHIVYY